MIARRTIALLAVAFAVSAGVLIFKVRSAALSAVSRAQVLLATGDAAQARSTLAWVVRYWPADSRAQYTLGQVLLAEKDYPAAAACFENVSPGAEVFEGSRQKLAACLLLDHRLEAAEAVMRTHLIRSPDAVPVRRQLASLLSGQFRTQEAIEVLREGFCEERLLSLDDRVALLQDLLTLRFNPPAVADCLHPLRVSLEKAPDQISVRLALARGLLETGQIEEAHILVERLPLDPVSESPEVLVLSRLLLDLGDAESATRRLESCHKAASEILETDSSQCDWLLQRSVLAEQSAAWREALALQSKAYELMPLDRKELARRARLLQRLGNVEEAARAYEDAHQQASAATELWQMIGDLQNRSPTPGECERIARRLHTRRHSDEAAQWETLSKLLPSQPSSREARHSEEMSL